MSDAQGREALSVIHINVQRTAKARWVKASQARGMKLTDWIIEQLENRAMKVRPIPEALASPPHQGRPPARPTPAPRPARAGQGAAGVGRASGRAAPG